MLHARFASLALAASLLPLGCGPTSSTPTSKPSPADEKVRDAEKATAEAAKAKRDEYVATMNKRLDELNVKYDELKVRAGKAEGEAKKDLEKKLESAKVKRDVAAKKLDELKAANHDRWEKVKDSMENAYDDLKGIFE